MIEAMPVNGSLDKELAKMGNVLVTLAETKGRMDLQDQRALMTGGRLDELSKAVADLTKRLNDER